MKGPVGGGGHSNFFFKLREKIYRIHFEVAAYKL